MEPLSDPYNDRVIKKLRPPPHKPISQCLLYPDNSKYQIEDNLIRPPYPNLLALFKVDAFPLNSCKV